MESEIPQKLINQWVFAADKSMADNEEMTFRSSKDEIPISRGKKIMEFRKNGQVIIQDIGPDDRPIYSEGKFTFEGPDIVKIFLENSKNPNSMTLKIINLTEELLTVMVQR